MTYDWVKDSLACHALILRLFALRVGSIRFHTIPEMYWIEQHGGIP